MSMRNWFKERRSRNDGPEASDPAGPIAELAALGPVPAPVRRHPIRTWGRYRSLSVHLERRFADMVVLTFGEIEDLLGFPLPDAARTRGEWWTSDLADEQPPQSDAWKMAGRTAKPNLMAGNVAFERVSRRVVGPRLETT